MRKAKGHPLIEMISHFQTGYFTQQQTSSQLNQPNTNFIYPTIPKYTILAIHSSLSEGKSVATALDPIRANFVYKPILLKENINVTNVYYNAISWLSCNDFKKFAPTFSSIFSSLNSIKDLIPENVYSYIFNTNITHYLEIESVFPSNLVEIIFDEIHPLIFDSVVNVIDSTIINQDTDSCRYLVNKLSDAIKDDYHSYSNFDFTKILNSIYQLAFNFNDFILNFMSVLASFRNESVLLQFVSDLPLIIFPKIQVFPAKLQELPKPKETELYKYDFYDKNLEFTFQIDAPDSFPNGLMTQHTSEFESVITYDNYFDESLISLFNNISHIFDSCLPIYLDTFFEIYSKSVCDIENKEFFTDFYCSFQYFLYKIPHFHLTPTIFHTLLNYIFTPGISSFNKCDNFDYIRFFRKNVLYIVSQHKPAMLNELLIKYERNPFLFADIIGCIHVRLSLFDVEMLTDETSLSSIIHAVSILDSLALELKDELYNTVQKARSTVFVFLFTLIENSATVVPCFSSSIFTSGFLSRVFEPSLQIPIISAIRQFLSNYSGIEVFQTIEFIGGLIAVCRKNQTQDNLALELVSCVNDSIGHNPKIASVCDPLLEPVTLFVTKRPSAHFLAQTLQLYSQLSLNNKNFQLELTQAQLLSKAIKQQSPDDETTMLLLLGIMARSRSASDKAMFFIHVPMFVLLLLSILNTKENCQKYLKLFSDLCHHSIYNCIQCHKAEFDLFLLELIKNGRKEFVFRGFEFNFPISEEDINEIIIPLLTYLSSYIYSPDLLNKLIETLHDFSNHSFDLMNSFSQSVSLLSQQPRVILLSGFEDRFIAIKNIKSTDIVKGFTIQLTVQFDTYLSQISSSRPLLFSITDELYNGFFLYIQGSSIVAKLVNGKTVSQAPMASNFCPCQWKSFSLVLYPSPKAPLEPSKITFSFDGDKETIFTLNYKPFHEGLLNVKIGGLLPHSEKTDFYVAIGGFRMFNKTLNRKQLKDLPTMQMSYNFSSNENLKDLFPIFSYPGKCNLEIPTEIVFPVNNNPLIQNILDVCSTENCFRALIPFFMHFNDMPNHFPGVFIDFLHYLIVYNQTPKIADLFSLIGHILIETCDAKKLNYQIYLKFFGLLDNCSEVSIINSIISNILFNIELWVSCDSAHLIRIITHWCITLLSAYPSQMSKFSEILAIVRIYFWYEPIEIEMIRGHKNSSRPRPDDLDIDTVKFNFGRMLLQISQNSFYLRDAVALISHSAACADSKSVIWMMSLFVQIAKTTKTVFHVSRTLCQMLYTQLKPRQEERFVLTLKVIYILSQDTFLYHANMIITLLNEYFATDLLYNKLLAELPEYPLIYPLCIFISTQVGETKSMADALGTLKIPNTQELLNDEFWCLFPIVLAHFVDEDGRYNLIKFILSVLTQDFQLSQLDSMICLMDVIESISIFDINEFISLFLLTLAQTVEKEHLEKVFYRCMKFILLHLTYEPTSDILKIAYINSPFYEVSINNCKTPIINRHSRERQALTMKRSHSVNVSNEIKGGMLYTPQRTRRSNIWSESDFLTFGEHLKIRSIEDILQILTRCDYSKSYQFRILLEEEQIMKDFVKFESVLKLFAQLETESDIIRSWKTFINYFTHRDEQKIIAIGPNINSFIDDYASSYGKKCYNQVILMKQRLIREIENCHINALKALERVDLTEIAIAVNDIDSFNVLLEYNRNKNIKMFSILTRKEMCLTSPFSQSTKFSTNQNSFDPKGKESDLIMTKDFCFSANFVQIRFKYSKSFAFHKSTIKPYYQKSSDTLFFIQCKKIKIGEEIPAIFEIKKKEISIITEKSVRNYQSESILQILQRTRLGRSTALEFFIENGRSYLLDFHPQLSSNILWQLKYIPNIGVIQHYSFSDFIYMTRITKLWANGKTSNFKYLMHLNFYTGRTFNDETMYPIMPWIVNSVKTKSEQCNSNEENIVFRDLSKPISLSNDSFVPPSAIGYYLGSVEPFKSLKKLMTIDEPNNISNNHTDQDSNHKFLRKSFVSLKDSWNDIQNQINTYELTPEFYYAPEYFKETDGISAEEFVYRHRRILESEKVSSQLHFWIDQIWGVARRGVPESENDISDEIKIKKIGQAPPQVFFKNHPIKQLDDESRFKKPFIFIPDAENPLFFTSLPDNKFFIVFSSGQLNHIEADFENPSYSEVLSTRFINNLNNLSSLNSFSSLNNLNSAIKSPSIHNIPNANSINNLNTNLNSEIYQFIPVENGFLLHDKYNITIYLSVTNEPIHLYFTLGVIEKVLFNEGIVACINNNNQISLWDLQSDNINSSEITIMNDKVTAISINRNFKEIVYGTPDGIIQSISLKGLFIFAANVEEAPQKILITESWGFVVVITSNFIFLISPNGKIIHKCDKKVEFSYLTTFQSTEGFDFIVASDSKGLIYLFEAFFLQIGEQIFNCRTEVRSISYSKIDKSLTVISEDNRAFIIPIKLPYIDF
ncbi:hypothetical protein TRFO_08405 [Tritrichomonas foetus]|uniref:Beige/BEACH domain containing protein n=1 Tax=Tritrichomonas foetus TaxID=1144522 RepID=A0A1J4JM12_9EUKA|nr:hypothetical protein TRFO_08405 [Tritrichomonas foetus]|eukprot:OHS99463.1 hypothetical protein TRFO_08405 [Tritrichomonas foetus]